MVVMVLSLQYNRLEQCCAAHNVHSCSQYCSALLHLFSSHSKPYRRFQTPHEELNCLAEPRGAIAINTPSLCKQLVFLNYERYECKALLPLLCEVNRRTFLQVFRKENGHIVHSNMRLTMT